MFALDSSGSIWAPDFKRQLNFVKDLVGAFQVSPRMTRIGVLTFGDEPKKQFLLDRYNNDEQVGTIFFVESSLATVKYTPPSGWHS